MTLTTQAGRLAELSESMSEIRALVRDNAAELREMRGLLHDETTGGVAQTVRQIGERLDALSEAVRDGRSELSGAVRQNYAQLEALIDVRALLQPRAPMPRLRGWAASPDVLRLLVERIAVDHAKIVVECGSGASTVWLGYAAQRFGGGRVIALEHDERFARSSRDLVLAHGLQDVVEVRHAPLTSWTAGGETIPWYDTRALDDLTDIGLVFVDGPPGATAPMVRYPAMPVLLPRCAPDAWFVLDDGARPAEREVADRWLREFPELTASAYPAEKGAMVLRRDKG
ncbi:class I SAM-dependent methyltransferase [Sphaerisporangium album]|uniref:Class I SAM-dependent methyltransferase n=2 Tax=Sphaerisporangium album TaxID=509200 RepID=A0A367FKI7_9ACTN|nr:class I SAM-dependent methyltransferase [Sphaerisporangium album]